MDAFWWRHKETHLAPGWPLHPDALKHAVPPRALCCCSEACIACGALCLLRAELHTDDQTHSPNSRSRGTLGAGCTLVVWAFGKLAGWSPGFAV